MKIAVTYESSQIFQHFGHTEQFKLYEAADGKITHTEVVDTNLFNKKFLMANIQERRNKVGKLISYSIRVHCGRGADVERAD